MKKQIYYRKPNKFHTTPKQRAKQQTQLILKKRKIKQVTMKKDTIRKLSTACREVPIMVIKIRTDPVSEFNSFVRIPAIPHHSTSMTLFHTKPRPLFQMH